jgi:lipopolysaccharide/colanic/teichoic acid biosynthesis glycosyltransferase
VRKIEDLQARMKNVLKRTLDFVTSFLGLMVASPLLIGIAVWIKLDSPGPVFYRGLRVGRFGRPFRIFKFRSMVVDAEKNGVSSTSNEDARVTRSGKFIRKWKLDELSQLINVLCGDMSLVGPRPEVQTFVDMYTPEERPILELRPGITDWASIWNADEGAVLAGAVDPDKTYEELIRPTKLRLQLEYVRHHNLWIDLRILCCTAYRILKKDWLPRELESFGRLTDNKRLAA